MMGRFVKKSGFLPPPVAGCREDYRIPIVLCVSGRHRHVQVAHSHQIVRRRSQGEHKVYPVLTSVTGLTEIAHGLHPAEDFLHPLP